MLYLDTETCGFHGPTVLIQYAIDDGEIQLHSVFTSRVRDTLELIEMLYTHVWVGFNLSFESFHLSQTYNVLRLLPPDCYPVDNIALYASKEAEARFGLCLKPPSAFDLMLHARKGPYQSMMDREDIRIKRIPTAIAQSLADLLDRYVPLKDIYFARKKDRKKRWSVMDIHDDTGERVEGFSDLVLKFAPSSALKVLAEDALGYDAKDVTVFSDIELPSSTYPEEFGYAPFFGSGTNWPDVISHHIRHWSYHPQAREYASDDVKYTRELHYYFSAQAAGKSDEEARFAARNLILVDYDLLPGGDDDSVLAVMVGTVRWHGYAIDVDKFSALLAASKARHASAIANFNSQAVCKIYLEQVLTEVERSVIRRNGKISTKGIILEDIAKWKVSVICSDCKGMGCDKCENEGLIKTSEKHPAALRALEILDYRHAGKEIELFEKILKAGRFHVSMNVIGALSGRMSGADGLNPQGIKAEKSVRSCFTLADKGYQLDGGDFSGFEISIADAVYNDPDLRKDILTKRPCTECAKWAQKTNNPVGTLNATCPECKGTGLEGTKIHALFGQFLFPGMSYDEIYATKGLPGEQDKYRRSKQGVFALLYGGEGFTLVSRVGVDEAVANAAYQGWIQKYQVWGQARKKIFDMFCSMRQIGGIGSRVTWQEPADYIETMFGFRRYFTLENKICKALFEIAENPPKEWGNYKYKVTRRDREQTVAGAARSALFGAAFAVQAGNMRAAANHVIQGTGAAATKTLQRRIWDLQPTGICRFTVLPMNIHDEVQVPCLPEVSGDIKAVVDKYLQELITTVPMAGIDWSQRMQSWAEK